jgi:hypothetical protein
MVWYVIGSLAFVAVFVIVIARYVRDRRYERLKTSQAMSRELWGEIEEERGEALKRRERFEQALSEAEREARSPSDINVRG